MTATEEKVRQTTISFEAVLALPFEEAVARCRAELATEGFGVLTEIDLQAKFKEKLGIESPPHLILGACHPASAYKAVRAVPEVAVMLPCNVTIAVEPRGTVVRAMNPGAAMQMFADATLEEVADEVGNRLRRALERVSRPA